MLLFDVNVLVYAYRKDAPDHVSFRAWLGQVLSSDEAYATSDLVLSGFLRVVTHPRVFASPAPIEHALGFANALRDHPNHVPVTPGARHWPIFTRLCREASVKGNLVPDAYLAALAIESGRPASPTLWRAEGGSALP
jgi:toxin-antitoxin system PIN domain toxin